MKIRALIIAATIAARRPLTAPTAQACVIYDDDGCMPTVVTNQPSTGVVKHKVTLPARHHKRHTRRLER